MLPQLLNLVCIIHFIFAVLLNVCNEYKCSYNLGNALNSSLSTYYILLLLKSPDVNQMNQVNTKLLGFEDRCLKSTLEHVL
jgi:hypothetical protein